MDYYVDVLLEETVLGRHDLAARADRRISSLHAVSGSGRRGGCVAQSCGRGSFQPHVSVVVPLFGSHYGM
jgi:hypothetical protein